MLSVTNLAFSFTFYLHHVWMTDGLSSYYVKSSAFSLHYTELIEEGFAWI